MHLLADVIAFGLFSSALLSIGAVGFTLQFGTTNVLNLAYGAVMTAALFIYYVVVQVHIPLVLSVVCAMIFGALFSWLLNAIIVSPYVRRGTSLFAMAMVMIAVGLIIQFSLEAIQGPVILSLPTSNSTELHFFGVTMSLIQILIIAVAIVLMAAVQALLRYTRLGLAMRATATDPALSRACGTSTRRVRAIAWLLSGALCGLCGTLLGINQGAFNSATGNEFFIVIVAAAIVGGIGKPTGAMLGALIIGIVTEAAAAVISPSYKDVVAFAVLVVVLLLRPQGILAEFAAQRELAV